MCVCVCVCVYVGAGVMGPSIRVNKLIHKIGQKQIMLNITEFTTNATNFMPFVTEKHLTVKR